MNTPVSSAEPPWLLTAREAAKAASLTIDQLRLLWAQGRGPERCRRGRLAYVDKQELERWMKVRDLDAAQTA